MNAHDLFPTQEERTEVRSWLDEGDTITQVLDENGEILYRNKLAIDTWI